MDSASFIPGNSKLMSKIIKASKGQRDAMFFASRRMNLISDLLGIPTAITSAILGSTLLSSKNSDHTWIKYFCASIAFVNIMLLTIQKVARPGEFGEMYQSYGRKWELFALNILSMRKWKTSDVYEDDDQPTSLSTSLIEKYNNMIEQSPLLPRWALNRFKESNDDLSSDEEDDAVIRHRHITIPDMTSLRNQLQRELSKKQIQGNKTKTSECEEPLQLSSTITIKSHEIRTSCPELSDVKTSKEID